MWEKVYLNAQNIEHSTANAVLIKMPTKSEYANYKFWHPAKLIRNEGAKGYHLSLSFNENFEFKIFKSGKGKYNKADIIDEKTISVDTFKKCFDIAPAKFVEAENKKDNTSFIHTKEPTKIDMDVVIDKDLKNE